MRVKLPIVTKPIMNTTNACSYSLGIVEQNTDYFDQILCTRFINCVYNKVDSPHFFVFDDDLWFDQCGLMECDPHNIFPHVCRESLSEQIKIVREKLIKGYYVYGRYNEKYISAKRDEIKRDNDHDYLLLGFDDDKEVYYAIGYVSGIYREFEISYRDYFEANDHSLQGCVNLFCFRVSSEYTPPACSAKVIRKAVSDYVNGKLPVFEALPLFESGDIVVGSKVWEILADYLETCDLHNIDMRDLHSFVDHKAGMARRIRYLVQNGIITEENLAVIAENIKKSADSAFFLAMKSIMTDKKQLMERVVKHIRQANESERNLLEKLLRRLKEHSVST